MKCLDKKYRHILGSMLVMTMLLKGSFVCANEIPEKIEKTLNYKAHLATGFLAQIALLVSASAGFVGGAIALNKGFDTYIYRKLNLQPALEEGLLNVSRNVMDGVMYPPVLVGILAGLYVIYKTPQWTDKYVLKKDSVRTSKQNIIVFLNRCIIPYPFGVVTGEFFNHEVQD
jgi:hypothetical protein